MVTKMNDDIEASSTAHHHENNEQFQKQHNDSDFGEFLSTDTGDYLVEEKSEYEKKCCFSAIETNISVFDVAAYILKKTGSITTMKLQKLVYYCQAWSLVWDEKPLFIENIEAWANGPVVRELFNFHRGMFDISSVSIGNPDLLDEEQRETVDSVLEFYGNKPSQWLIDLTHQEKPWQNARKGLRVTDRGHRIIPLDEIADYYSSLEDVS